MGETRERAADEVAGRDRDAGNTIQRIVSEPQNYYGKTVTVMGEVEKVMNPHAVRINGGGMLNDEILVVSKKTLPNVAARTNAPEMAENDMVHVTGTVRRFNMTEVEKDIGFDLDNDAFSDWNDKPVLVASDITVTPAGQGGAGRKY